jgi:hypothetical protein
VYVQFEGNSPMVGELRRSFGSATGCGFTVTQRWWRGVGDLSRSSLPSGWDGGVLCRVRLFLFWGLFMWWCPLRPVMWISFLLIWHRSAPALIKKTPHPLTYI